MSVLFDLDGTLTDPFEGIRRSVEHALDRLGVAAPAPEALRTWVGPPLAESFASLLGDAALAGRAVSLYRERFAEVGLFENALIPGIDEALDAVGERCGALFVATTKPRVYAARIIEHFALARHFVAVHGAELDGTRADKGELIAHILETEALAAPDVVMVGDRSHDVVGAAANGVEAVGVTWGYGSRAELVEAGAAVVCTAPADLAHAIGRARRPGVAGARG